MIPAQPGYCAIFEDSHGGELGFEVLAWDDDGYPMVLPSLQRGTRRIMSANELPGYVRVQTDHRYSRDHYVAIAPANGWRVRWPNNEEEGGWTEPLAAWGLTALGEVVPLEGPIEGTLAPPGHEAEVYHPDRHLLPKLDGTETDTGA